jgi:hypothetical protein
MVISEIDESTIDYDWFAIDDEGVVGHFATGGCGIMPRSVAASADDLMTITDFFQKEAVAGTSTRLSPTLGLHVAFKTSAEEERYLQSFLKMASRGLFSFNAVNSVIRPVGYFRVIDPVVPLPLSSLPMRIRIILERTRLKEVSFRTADVIQVETIRWAEAGKG